jgi:hypothetical protein
MMPRGRSDVKSRKVLARGRFIATPADSGHKHPCRILAACSRHQFLVAIEKQGYSTPTIAAGNGSG